MRGRCLVHTCCGEVKQTEMTHVCLVPVCTDGDQSPLCLEVRYNITVLGKPLHSSIHIMPAELDMAQKLMQTFGRLMPVWHGALSGMKSSSEVSFCWLTKGDRRQKTVNSVPSWQHLWSVGCLFFLCNHAFLFILSYSSVSPKCVPLCCVTQLLCVSTHTATVHEYVTACAATAT